MCASTLRARSKQIAGVALMSMSRRITAIGSPPSAWRVQLDDVSVGVRDVDLPPWRHIIGPEDAFDAGRLQRRHRPVVIRDAKRQVPVAQVDRQRAAQRAWVLVDDQMQLAAVAHLIPRAAEGKRRAGDFLQAEDLAVELLRP